MQVIQMMEDIAKFINYKALHDLDIWEKVDCSVVLNPDILASGILYWKAEQKKFVIHVNPLYLRYVKDLVFVVAHETRHIYQMIHYPEQVSKYAPILNDLPFIEYIQTPVEQDANRYARDCIKDNRFRMSLDEHIDTHFYLLFQSALEVHYKDVENLTYNPSYL
jgi:hypothetical protein